MLLENIKDFGKNMNKAWEGKEQRHNKRRSVDHALEAFEQHMRKVKVALAKGDIKTAEKLVDGAIAALSNR